MYAIWGKKVLPCQENAIICLQSEDQENYLIKQL